MQEERNEDESPVPPGLSLTFQSYNFKFPLTTIIHHPPPSFSFRAYIFCSFVYISQNQTNCKTSVSTQSPLGRSANALLIRDYKRGLSDEVRLSDVVNIV